MRRSSLLATASAVFAASCLVSSSAFAAPILAGQTANATFENNPGVALPSQTFVTPFFTGNYDGQVTTRIYNPGVDTTNTLGGITFVYEVENFAGGGNAITGFTINGYLSYATDMSYQLGTGNVAPTFVDRASGISPVGDVVAFRFFGTPIGAGVLTPGNTSELLVVQTNAPEWNFKVASVMNGTVSQMNVPGPTGVVPEPASLAVLAGSTLLAGRRRR